MPVGSTDQGAYLLQRFAPGVSAESGFRTGRPPRRAMLKTPLRWHHLGLWRNDQVIVIGGGRVRRIATVVPLHKIQSLRLVQGPLSRWLRLATVHVDLVGRHWPTALHARDQAEARTLLAELAECAHAARQTDRLPAA